MSLVEHWVIQSPNKELFSWTNSIILDHNNQTRRSVMCSATLLGKFNNLRFVFKQRFAVEAQAWLLCTMQQNQTISLWQHVFRSRQHTDVFLIIPAHAQSKSGFFSILNERKNLVLCTSCAYSLDSEAVGKRMNHRHFPPCVIVPQ